MNVLDLFSGIGGFSLGLERAGMRTIAFCEIEPWCRAVLAKHWPSVPAHDDITTREFREGEADVICGGFPCQDISLAGEGAGLAGSRSGLYRELVRAIRLVRPRFAIVENVAALLARGMGTVLGDLAEIGYNAEWHCIPAAAVGAPHRRDRVWIVANPDRNRRLTRRQSDTAQGEEWRQSYRGGQHGDVSDAVGDQLRHQPGWQRGPCGAGTAEPGDDGAQRALAHAIGAGLEGSPILAGYIAEQLAAIERDREAFPDADGEGCPQPIGPSEALSGAGPREPAGPECSGWNPWLVEPDVGRVADGVPNRVDRLKGLGNAVVPQIPEIIGRAIMNSVNAPFGDKP